MWLYWFLLFFFSSRRRHTRWPRDWSSDVCSSDLVAGSAAGVTALQMDIKIEGINEEIMERALEQAHAARLHILEQMNEVIAQSRAEISENAPSMATIKIDPEKIRDVIGKGGATIRKICEDTGASIDLDDDGTVRIYADDKVAAKKAIDTVLA